MLTDYGDRASFPAVLTGLTRRLDAQLTLELWNRPREGAVGCRSRAARRRCFGFGRGRTRPKRPNRIGTIEIQNQEAAGAAAGCGLLDPLHRDSGTAGTVRRRSPAGEFTE